MPAFETNRPTVPAIDSILGHEFRVLDRGFVRVVDYMGDDAAIVQAARVSYGQGTKTKSDDRALIRYLMANRHTSPFEMCEIKLHVKLPIFVARQWVRHRTAQINEYSARYSDALDDVYIPDLENLAKQSKENKQGRSDRFANDEASKIRDMILGNWNDAHEYYNDLREQNLAREIARIVLPLNTYTEWYWKIDLHNLLHFLTLRCDSHAQLEIRRYADQIAEIVKLWVPEAHQAWVDYRRDAVIMSAPAVNVLRQWAERDFYAVRSMIEGAENMTAREKTDLLVALQVGGSTA